MDVGGGRGFHDHLLGGGGSAPDRIYDEELTELAGKVYDVLEQGRGKNGIRVALNRKGEDYALEQISTVLDLMVEGGILEIVEDGFGEMYQRLGPRPTH